jgi:hypothetical protein
MKLIKKLYQIGEYSYSMIVPKDWLLRNNQPLEVEVKVKKNRLIVVPIKTNKESKDANKR